MSRCRTKDTWDLGGGIGFSGSLCYYPAPSWAQSALCPVPPTSLPSSQVVAILTAAHFPLVSGYCRGLALTGAGISAGAVWSLPVAKCLMALLRQLLSGHRTDCWRCPSIELGCKSTMSEKREAQTKKGSLAKYCWFGFSSI